jgi:hypothetical protein
MTFRSQLKSAYNNFQRMQEQREKLFDYIKMQILEKVAREGVFKVTVELPEDEIYPIYLVREVREMCLKEGINFSEDDLKPSKSVADGVGRGYRFHISVDVDK